MKYLFVGHSHLGALFNGWRELNPVGVTAAFVNVTHERFRRPGLAAAVVRNQADEIAAIDMPKLIAELAAEGSTARHLVYVLNGNEHNIRSYSARAARNSWYSDYRWKKEMTAAYEGWISKIRDALPKDQQVLLPPPPIENEAWIRANAGVLSPVIDGCPMLAGHQRLRFWKMQCETMRDVARRYGIAVLENPADVLSANGFLAEDCRRDQDVTHANALYGRRVLSALLPRAALDPDRNKPRGAGPYLGLPEAAFWRTAVSGVAPGSVDPAIDLPFRLQASDRIATAGSCFAQHLSRRLMTAGFKVLQMEGSAQSGEDPYDYSARYGNIYTARQLLQLFDRAFGTFEPADRAWPREDGRYCDPFRPAFRSAGFDSEADVQLEQQRHLAAVRDMFQQLDVMVFTLGLTECFVRRSDGAVFPVAPGVAGGRFDEALYEFKNLSLCEVRDDLMSFLGKLRVINPRAKLVLTVSPVPLVATRSGKHVLLASTHSKAVLRVAAAEVEAACEHVMYFPSYEIITGSHAPQGYFDPNRRTIGRNGVDHVMRLFMQHAAESCPDPQPARAPVSARNIDQLAKTLCDEELIDAGL